MSFGTEEHEVCWRDGCEGLIAIRPPENCSCHINPPCGECSSPREFCPECEWSASDEETAHTNQDDAIRIDTEHGGVTWPKDRPLDPQKIDWHDRPHTRSSMIKEGIYPEGTSAAEVRALVDGTFGGRFDSFGNGRFRFVAYTD